MALTTLGGDPPPGTARWEPPVWTVLLFTAVCTRLYGLGTRVMTHDESLHAQMSFGLFTTGVYQHDPTYHGPLLYHVNALVYFLFGATDVTARLAPALIGVAIVGSMWLFRRYIGRVGAACTAALLTVSPTLLFYSRHIREDIHVALFTIVWVYAAFRYLEDRRPRWLYALTAGMALSFITKESSFVFGAIIGSFLVFHAIWPSRTDEGRGLRRASADLAMLMLTLVLPFTAGLGYVAFGWDPIEREPERSRLIGGAALGAALFALSAAAGFWWCARRRAAAIAGTVSFGAWARVTAIFWTIQVVFFTSFFANTRGGLITGIAGSLGYWLTQHEVERGSQPWFYYLLIGALYEFLPMLVGGAGMVLAARAVRDPDADPVRSDDSPIDADARQRATRRLFLIFCAWWALASWAGYAWAGERMPWLLTHQVLPLIVLAGWAMARVLRVDPDRPGLRATATLALGTALTIPLVIGVVRTVPRGTGDLAGVAATTGWWTRVVVLVGLLLWLVSVFTRYRERRARDDAPAGPGGGSARIAPRSSPAGWFARGLALGVLIVLGAFTLRASLQVSYVNYDMATEPLSYAQAGPDVRRVVRAIEHMSERTVGTNAIAVAFDDESSWPFSWYFRRYGNARTWDTDPALIGSAPVILAGEKNLAALQPYVAAGYTSQRYVSYWWPLQDYAQATPATLWTSLQQPSFHEYVWGVFSRRDWGVSTDAWPLRREIWMFVRNDVAAASAPLLSTTGAAGRVPPPAVGSTAPEQIISGPFAGLPLSGPTGLAVAADGAWAIADGGNHRVVVLNPDGTFRMAIGAGPCAIDRPDDAGCLDPDGRGPRARGDGQFNEPWGIASGPDGEWFVADTWNGRIQVFDRRGVFQRAWGRFGQLAGQPDQNAVWLYGPRGLVVDEAGRVVVADTGNNRLLTFDGSGARHGAAASPLVDESFDEPTAVARDGNHTLLVADAWNQRIVRLDTRGHTMASWRVPGWMSRSAEHKPFLAVDDDGFVYATDPESGSVFVFAASGTLETIVRLPGARPRPTGIAVDRARQRLLVADHAAGSVLVFPLYRADR